MYFMLEHIYHLSKFFVFVPVICDIFLDRTKGFFEQWQADMQLLLVSAG